MEGVLAQRLCSKYMHRLFNSTRNFSRLHYCSRMPVQRTLYTRNTSLLKRTQLKPSQNEIRGAATRPAGNKNVAWAVTLALTGVGGIAYYVIDNMAQKSKKVKIKQETQVVGKIEIGGKPWTLTDHNGVTRTDKDFEGQWVLFYFGFTHCPDVCPEELDKLAKVEAVFRQRNDLPSIQLLFVTLDPERDTPKAIKKYCKEFSPTLLGLTGTAEQLESMRKIYRIFFSTGPVDDSGDYLIDHAIISYLVRPDGSFADYYPKRVDKKTMVQQIEIKMKRYEKEKKKE
ncbi:protein SCO1 homolog, mitochondrial-like [Mizuhopecten yessoensis]|uniref:SCO1-like protein n=1 Tax=Mizuhopecten yessoensis TaxID=6573 RepID=A0A210R6U3_MIZYE|nr:protein SCO1 homolog, mitochondrial-like [Mizuhopecten yessoensis]OWF56773.1 SCO1-like protein [Mizuhopecten yessoensis]